jgi:hypothetical protein
VFGPPGAEVGVGDGEFADESGEVGVFGRLHAEGGDGVAGVVFPVQVHAAEWMSIEVFGKAVGPKEIHWVEGASHVDLYDKERYVGPAVEKLTGFYSDELGKTV